MCCGSDNTRVTINHCKLRKECNCISEPVVPITLFEERVNKKRQKSHSTTKQYTPDLGEFSYSSSVLWAQLCTRYFVRSASVIHSEVEISQLRCEWCTSIQVWVAEKMKWMSFVHDGNLRYTSTNDFYCFAHCRGCFNTNPKSNDCTKTSVPFSFSKPQEHDTLN